MGRNKSNNFSVELAKSAAQVFAEEREKVEIIAARVLNTGWKPIGESANEIVARAKRRLHLDGWDAILFEKAGFQEGVDFVVIEPQELDTDWITEYLAYHDKPWDVSTTE